MEDQNENTLAVNKDVLQKPFTYYSREDRRPRIEALANQCFDLMLQQCLDDRGITAVADKLKDLCEVRGSEIRGVRAPFEP